MSESQSSVSKEHEPLLISQSRRGRLYGRAKEVEALQALLRPTSQRVTLAFVEGPSGSGKSALIQEVFYSQIQSHPQFVVGRGNFEEFRGRQPFAALRQCLRTFLSQLSSTQIRTLRNSLDLMDKETLDGFCPICMRLLERQNSARELAEQSTSQPSDTDDMSIAGDNLAGIDHVTGFVKLKNVMASLFRKLAYLVAPLPLVWLLDDIMWMDESSLAIVQHVLHHLQQTTTHPDKEEQQYRVVCVQSYRTKQLPAFLAKWQQSSWSDAPVISLRELTAEAAHELIVDLLNVHTTSAALPSTDGAIEELVNWVVEMTGGQAFDVLQLLDYLQQVYLLYRNDESSPDNRSTVSWKWDMDKIKADASLQAEKKEDKTRLWITSARLRQLPLGTRRLLQAAACLGYFFDRRMLRVSFEAAAPMSPGVASVQDLLSQHLQQALEEDFILEAHEFGMYRFSHARIHEAALAMVDECAVDQDLRWLIGKALWKEALWNDWQLSSSAELFEKSENHGVNKKKLKKMSHRILFVCADLLNHSRDHFVRDTKDDAAGEQGDSIMKEYYLARLNYEAGRRCIRLNAYVPAIDYLRASIDILNSGESSAWELHHNLMAELHAALAEACLCCGRLDDIPPVVDHALLHTAKLPETYQLRYAALQRLVMENQIGELVDESLVVLESLGEQFSKTTSEANLVIRRKQVMGQLASLSDEAIMRLPKLQDASKKAALQIMANILAPVQYFSKYHILTKIIQLRMVEISLLHGLSKYTANCFGFGAFALFDEGNKQQYEAAIRCSKLGLAMAKMAGEENWHKEIAPDGLVFRHWTLPYVTDVDDAMTMYEENLKCGELVTAFQAVALYLYSYYFSGLALGPLVADLDTISRVKVEYGQNLRLLHMLPIYQLVLNLTGNSPDILDMYHGKAMDHRERLGWGQRSRDGEEAQWAYSLQLYVYCDNWALADEMYNKMVKKDPGFLRGFPLWHVRVVFFALVAIHRVKVAPWYKRAILRREVTKHVSLIQLWVQQRSAINLVHKFNLIQAELLTIKPKLPDDAALRRAYDKAIQAAMKSGYLQDAGLAAHLAAHAVRDPERQEHYVLLAEEAYERWGAGGLVKHLRDCSPLYAKAQRRTESADLSQGFRSRKRFDASITSVHKEIALETTS